MKYKVLDINLMYANAVIFVCGGFLFALVLLVLGGQISTPPFILVLNIIACVACFVVGIVVLNINVVKTKD